MIRVFIIPYPRDKDFSSWCKSLVSRRLAASINVVAAKSFFIWENKLQEADEVLIFAKTSIEKAEALKQAVAAEHPYKVPAVIELSPTDVNMPYISWVKETTSDETLHPVGGEHRV